MSAGMKTYYDLGSYGRKVTNASAEAQRWFDRGLVWTYAFNHEEAVRCFERALATDPDCVMAHWGLAYALGPNYNKPWESFDSVDLAATVSSAFTASQEALKRSSLGSGVESALAEALSARYPSGTPAEDCSEWNAEYADAMRRVYHDYPDDLDVATLFADALMNLTPWALWDQGTGEPADGASTAEAKDVLDRALEATASREHPGVLHMYIHLMEMSPRPELAIRVGDLLRHLVPDAGHLRHMPTHIDILCGDYRSVVETNSDAIAADEKFLEREGPMNFYSLYRAHNYHFKIYGAMFLGQSAVALETADQLIAMIPESLLRVDVPPMADWLEGFLPMKLHAQIRFGRWQDIINAPLPDDPDLYCVTTAMLHYAKGVAHAATGQIPQAERERALFLTAVERVPESRTVFNNTCRDILQVAAAMLDGELEYRRGNYDAAFAHLRHSIELDDTLPYDEPWAWMQPTRHAYGALLLEQGRLEEAEAVYRADLGLDRTLARACQHPGNVWSLHGYHECLVQLGRHEQAAIIEQQLDIAKARADVPINASCFCRLSAQDPDGGSPEGATAYSTCSASRPD
ncbi:MAG: tetratricopeptide repeat protein [Ornithinimicrobium sp.]|uniref:tetratricopeptide repeat protein n=1 Tax=Ornithinimicrobium sp. TaxID=1977084 RepID=UPI0026DF4F0A|nr:tetratricopeptide repeat protein [Ornithinimicrobium sp.]MDO5739401.1 tetratricopeptide repeat protein [Ornithinimicrobium sp.]